MIVPQCASRHHFARTGYKRGHCRRLERPVHESDPQLILVDNPVRNRYEARIGDKLAGFVTYVTKPGLVVLVHTEVEPEFEGAGVGGRLASAVLEALRAGGQQVDPVCPFISSYIERHSEYADLVASPDP